MQAPALTSCPAIVSLEPGFVAAWVKIGTTYERQHKPSEAERYYRKAVEIDPNNWEALGDLGDILRHQGKFIEAKNFLLKARACPENWKHPGEIDKLLEQCH